VAANRAVAGPLPQFYRDLKNRFPEMAAVTVE
jgi:hypothetical protein